MSLTITQAVSPYFKEIYFGQAMRLKEDLTHRVTIEFECSKKPREFDIALCLKELFTEEDYIFLQNQYGPYIRGVNIGEHLERKSHNTYNVLIVLVFFWNDQQKLKEYNDLIHLERL